MASRSSLNPLSMGSSLNDASYNSEAGMPPNGGMSAFNSRNPARSRAPAPHSRLLEDLPGASNDTNPAHDRGHREYTKIQETIDAMLTINQQMHLIVKMHPPTLARILSLSSPCVTCPKQNLVFSRPTSMLFCLTTISAVISQPRLLGLQLVMKSPSVRTRSRRLHCILLLTGSAVTYLFGAAHRVARRPPRTYPVLPPHAH